MNQQQQSVAYGGSTISKHTAYIYTSVTDSGRLDLLKCTFCPVYTYDLFGTSRNGATLVETFPLADLCTSMQMKQLENFSGDLFTQAMLCPDAIKGVPKHCEKCPRHFKKLFVHWKLSGTL